MFNIGECAGRARVVLGFFSRANIVSVAIISIHPPGSALIAETLVSDGFIRVFA